MERHGRKKGTDAFLIQVTKERCDTEPLTKRDFNQNFVGHFILRIISLITEKLILWSKSKVTAGASPLWISVKNWLLSEGGGYGASRGCVSSAHQTFTEHFQGPELEMIQVLRHQRTMITMEQSLIPKCLFLVEEKFRTLGLSVLM